jgi:hypothetical protein
MTPINIVLAVIAVANLAALAYLRHLLARDSGKCWAAG